MSKESDKYPAQHEAFEKWHSLIFEQHIQSIRQEYGYPADSIVQTRWQAWSFAWQAARQQDRELISELVKGLKTIAAQEAFAGEVNGQVIGNFYETGIAKDILIKYNLRLKEVS